MNAVAAIIEPARDLVSTAGVFNDKHFLFRCEMIVLAGNIRTLLEEYERGRAALCQNIAVAYLRIQRGDLGISWETWCERFVRKQNGQPYSAATIGTWLKIGMKPDVQAAWESYRQSTRNSRADTRRLSAVHEKAVAHDRLERVLGPHMSARLKEVSPQSLCDRPQDREIRQFKVLLAAWEAAEESVRKAFLRHIGADPEKRTLPVPSAEFAEGNVS